MKRGPFWALGAVLLALAGVALWLDRQFPGPPTAGSASGAGVTVSHATIMATSFPDADGRQQSLGQWQGKLLIVNFWATWCAPCREEMPIFSAMQRKYAAKSVQFIGIGADSVAKVKEFESQFPMAYPLLADPAGAIELSRRLGNRLGLLPHTVVYAPNGTLILSKLGPFKFEEIEAIIVENLSK